MKEQATYLAYAGGWRAVRLMPESMAYALFDRVADQQWRAHGASVQRLEANLARVVGPVAPDELREVSREGMRSYLRYWCDAFRLPGWDRARIDSVEMRAPRAAADAGGLGPRRHRRPAAHGQLGPRRGLVPRQHVSPVNTVAEKLEPEAAVPAFVDFRDVARDAHPRSRATRCVYQELRRHPEAGRARRAAGRPGPVRQRGVDVQFFGETARFPAGPAALAVDTGARWSR